jgi:heme-degrading monooxygenase HmoA
MVKIDKKFTFTGRWQMYGTVAHLHVQPGMEAAFEEWARAEVGEYATIPGLVAVHLYRTDSDDHHWVMAVRFTDRAAYTANAARLEQHTVYLQMRRCLDRDPEWHDGEIVYTTK